MTDKFGNKIETGDYVVRHNGSPYSYPEVLYRIAGIDEVKDRIFIVPVLGWYVEFDFEKACENPAKYIMEHYGCFSPTHKTIVKTYKPDTL